MNLKIYALCCGRNLEANLGKQVNRKRRRNANDDTNQKKRLKMSDFVKDVEVKGNDSSGNDDYDSENSSDERFIASNTPPSIHDDTDLTQGVSNTSSTQDEEEYPNDSQSSEGHDPNKFDEEDTTYEPRAHLLEPVSLARPRRSTRIRAPTKHYIDEVTGNNIGDYHGHDSDSDSSGEFLPKLVIKSSFLCFVFEFETNVVIVSC